MRRISLSILILVFLFLSSFSQAKTQKEEYKNDYLYSEAYFDYLIECAQEEKSEPKEKIQEEILLEDEKDIVTTDLTPFKLKIENNAKVSPYGETFKKVDAKTIIPINENFSFVQNLTKTRNKYSSNDYRILMGAEYDFNKYIGLSGGIESNYQDINQNPTSRKAYVIPSVYFNNKISLSFYNKINVQSYSTDHDLSLSISPFKSKIVDFRVYAGLTRKHSGSHSESVNFTTNFYF